MAGIFVGARIAPESRLLIRNYVAALGLPPEAKPLPLSEYHVTIVDSKVSLPIDYPLDRSHSLATAYDIRYIGNALAIILESPWLRWRYNIARLCGYRSDFPGLIPHLTVVYDPPPNLPVAWWPKPPRMPIGLIGEYTETLKK